MPAQKTVLIIEDDKAVGDLFRVLLESDGFVVECCNNGASALELAKETCFDVIITDYRMPGMNGVDAARRLRIRCPGSFIIGISAERRSRDFIEAGADAFFKKPCLFRDLLELIHERLPPDPGPPKR